MALHLRKYSPHGPPCQAIADSLLTTTRASRITFRIATPVPGLLPVFIEALSPSEHNLVSLLSEPDIDLSQAATLHLIASTRKILLQRDCLDSSVPCPKALVERYGARSQILVPAFWEDKIWGFLSIHEAKGGRAWDEETGVVEMVAAATREIAKALGTRVEVPGSEEVVVA